MPAPPKIFIEADIPMFEARMAHMGETYSSMRKQDILSRNLTDRFSKAKANGEDTVLIPERAHRDVARYLNISPVALARPGEFGRVAREYPEHVPMLETYRGDDPLERIAQPLGLAAAKQIASLTTDSDYMGVIEPTPTSEAPPRQADRIEMERAFFRRNAAMLKPRLRWDYAVDDDVVLKHSVSLEKAAASITSEEFEPELGAWGSSPGEMKEMISAAREKRFAREKIPSDLHFKDQGLRVFYSFTVHYVQISAKFYDFLEHHYQISEEEWADDYEETAKGTYEFLCKMPVLVHRFIVGPDHAPFIYLRMPPETRRIETRIETDLRFAGMPEEYGSDTQIVMDRTFNVHGHRELMSKAAELGLLQTGSTEME